MTWRADLSAPARRDLKRMDRQAAARVLTAVERYAATEQGDVKRLTDVRPPQWRLRVGSWRVLFTFDAAAGALTVLRVLPRGEAYR